MGRRAESKKRQSRSLSKQLLGWAEAMDARTKRWAGLVTIVALLIALAAWLVPRDGSPSAYIQPSNAPAHLNLVGASVANPSRGPHGYARLEITLHNTGGRLAVIDQGDIRIDHVYRVPVCASQGDLALSGTYGVDLPVDAHPGATVQASLHQQIGPDEADRFAISFSALPADKRPAVYLFDLDVGLVNDGHEILFQLGEFSFRCRGWVDASHRSAREQWGSAMPCWRSNTVILRRALRGASIHSSDLPSPSELVTPDFAAIE